MALGAKPAHVLSVDPAPVLASGRRPGWLPGSAAPRLLSQLLRRELYGISHLDPIAYLTVVGALRRAVTRRGAGAGAARAARRSAARASLRIAVRSRRVRLPV